VNNPG